MKRAKIRNPAVWAMYCLRELEARGDMVRGAPAAGGQPAPPRWTYASVKRMSAFLQSSLKEGTQWVVFEPNGPELWDRIRLEVGAFMQTLFLQGAFQGRAASQAYFVTCDATVNTQATMQEGVVNIVVGFAPVYPAEFVVLPISQMTGQPTPADGE